MSLTIAIPGLIWLDSGDIEYLSENIKTTHLDRLLKPAKIAKHDYSYSDFLCGIYSCIDNDSDTEQNNKSTISSKVAEQLKVNHEFPYFLVAEPTHLRIDRDRLLISEANLLQLDKDESHAIINLINSHFSPDFKLYYVNEHLWLLGSNIDPVNEKFYPVLDIIGENINDYLPSQKNSLKYNKFLNELQMLLFNSDVNRIRKTEGSLEVSSIWLWDKQLANKFIYDEVFRNDNSLLLNYDKIQSLPSNLETTFNTNKNTLVIIDKLYYPAVYRDSYAWLQHLESIDQQVFRLLDKVKEFTILVLGSNQTLELKIKKRLFLNLFCKNNLINLARIWHAS